MKTTLLSALSLLTKWRKRLRVSGSVDGLLPLALVGVHHVLHFGFQFGADAQLVVASRRDFR